MIYMITLNMFVRGEYNVNWLCRVEHIIIYSCVLTYLWYNQSTFDTKQSNHIFHKRI